MSSTNTQIIPHSPPPPSSKSTHQFTYDVFLSFRGEDTRRGFTHQLYTALIFDKIHTFRDDEELERGGVIESELLKAIEESKIFVIIFSENYASSRWCLDELVKISECMATEQRLILPIFYRVDPSHVRKQSGSYKKAFDDHEKEADEEKTEKIQKWRTALTKVGNLAGYDLQTYRYDEELIEEITYDIRKKLNCKCLYVSENIVGMDFHLEQLKSFIDIESNKVRMVGIYGLGGIGKTTISEVVYNNISYQFQSSIFLKNVRERSKDESSLLQLQKELLNGVVKGKNLEISNVKEGIIVIQKRFSSKKVLVILDDVDKLEQLNSLAGKPDWFGAGSRIIITSRDQHLLTHKVDASYEVKALKYKESIQLFCRHAFKQNIPKKDYVDLSNHVVDYVKGLPLALEVLGSFLFDKSVSDWESTLQKLKRKPNMEVQNVLRISFDGLDVTEKEIFLDIACFFKGWIKDDVVRLLEHAQIGITVLIDKCLLTLSGCTISMHDLVQEMGREIVREEHPKEPRKWSRLWDLEDIRHVLKKKKGTKAIEGIFLDMSRSREISFSTEAFKKMERLRLLKVYWGYGFDNYMGKEPQKLLLPKDFEFPSHNLRYLHWEGYSLKSLPAKFDGENLIELNLNDSNIEQLWQGKKDLEELKILTLSKSQQLMEIPDLSNMLNLEQLNIDHCESLDKVDSSIGFLQKLTFLNLSGCTKIRSLPTSICRLKSLTELNLCGCSNLEIFPEFVEDMESLKFLDLSGTGIKELPSSIGYLNHLISLRLGNCKNLKSLPSSICRLKSLPELNLSGLSNLEIFPEIMEDMESLKNLDLSGTGIKELPSSIGYLNHLIFLLLENCKNLRSLPSSICRLKSLTELNLSGCSNLEIFPEIVEDMESLKNLDLSGTGIKELPSSIGYLNHLISLRLGNCKNLRSLPSSICRLKSLPELNLSGLSNLEIFPKIMEDMESLKNLDLSRTGIKELPSSIGYLNHLISLRLDNCKNLRSLPSSICRLKSLTKLYLSHCNMLEEIPELPSSLKEMDAYCCTSLGTLSNPFSLLWSSFLKWFNKIEPPLEWVSTRLGSNGIAAGWVSHQEMGRVCINPRGNGIGIPRWVSHQEMGSQIRIELPMNWYQDDHFLGFGLFCQGHDYMGAPGCECYWVNDNELGEVWVVYYPKISIPDKFHSNQYIHLQATFSTFKRRCPRNIKSCGIHLIYSQDLQQNHISLDDEHNQMPMSLNLPENSGDNRLIAKHERLSKSNTYLKCISTYYKRRNQVSLKFSFKNFEFEEESD